MLDKVTRDRIADFFTAAELVEYLQIDVRDVIDDHADEVEEALDDIDELMGVRNARE